tara:strand:+ start:190 stop:309 length:120 start_codon:yes stop_codon:yes gene_type:complete
MIHRPNSHFQTDCKVAQPCLELLKTGLASDYIGGATGGI